jgi:hypothetical protein
MSTNNLSPDMRRILKEEITKEQLQCPARSGFGEMQLQVQDIHEVLIGSSNRYYKDKKTGKGLVERLIPVVEHYESWTEKGNWDLLKVIILNHIVSTRVKIFLGVGSASGILALILAIGAVYHLVSGTN